MSVLTIALLPLWVATAPIFFVVLLPFVILLRFSVSVIAKIFRPDLAEIFSRKGVLLAVNEDIYTRPQLNILTHFVCSGNVTVDRIREIFHQRVLSLKDRNGNQVYRKFRQTWTPYLGYYFWKTDEDFNLENHIREYDHTALGLALPETKCTEEDLVRVTSNLLRQPYVKGRSPWELLIIRNYVDKENPGKAASVISLRLHHAMSDGYSIVNMTNRFANYGNECLLKYAPPKLPWWKNVVYLLTVAWKLPLDFVNHYRNSIDGPNAWHLLDTELSRDYHIFCSDNVPVEKTKEIKRKYGVGYNAVLFSLVAGGVRGLMVEAGQELPERMTAIVPVPLADHPDGMDFHASFVTFKFSPCTEDPRERLGEIWKNLMKSAESSCTLITSLDWAMSFTSLLPIYLIRLLNFEQMMTIVMSNFPAQETAVHLYDDCSVLYTIQAGGHNNGPVGAASLTVSMGGRQRIVLAVDKAAFANYKIPQNFANIIAKELEVLLKKG